MPAITGTTIMILTNVGLQLFNSMRGNRTNEAMRQKQQEFQRASQERNHERMMQLLRESQALQEEWEKEMHDTRVNHINEDFDQLISRVFQQQALQHWPLSVLPMVMKNQSLGSYRAKSDENIALHVILTPSNSQSFNNSVFPQIEQGVEAFCNRHWNTHSNHPILFYGGAWKSRTAPSQNEISQLKADLPHLPVLLITPYFSDNDDKLVFNIYIWGVGQEQDAVIVPTEKEFSYYNIYAKEMNYGEELTSTTIEEFIPYLQCLIGYLADVYFWSAHAVAPILPSLLMMGAINTDGMKYLFAHSENNYSLLLNEAEQEKKSKKSFNDSDLLNLLFAISPLLEQKEQALKLRDIIYTYCIDTLNIPSSNVDYLWSCISEMELDKQKPADFLLPTEIVPVLFLLNRKNLINSDKLLYLCSCVSLYNPLLAFNISELMSMVESLYPHSIVRFRFVNSNIVLCFTSSRDTSVYSNCFGALLYKSEKKYNGGEFCWDVEHKRFVQSAPSLDIGYIISDNLIAKLNKEDIKEYQSFSKAMIELGGKLAINYKDIISHLELRALSYKNILSWVKENYETGESLIILAFAHGEYQYTMGLLEKNDQWSLKKYIGAKSFHIDSSIKEKMKNNSILIQKIK